MILREAYEEGRQQLEAAGVRDADLDAWYLLEHVTGIDRAAYYADMSKLLSAVHYQRYKHCIEQRAERIPLQHITGVQEFMGLEFEVDEHVLIPRQDTECLIEAAEERLTNSHMKLLDMCTGSGCILISLIKRQKFERGTGADVSAEALKIARKNAEKHGVAAEFIGGDLFANITGVYDMIVSNPPYIPTGEIEGLEPEVGRHDPALALDGKEDGLHFYRRIIAESPVYLKKSGWLLLEIGCGQGPAVRRMMESADFKEISVVSDLSGLDRVVCGSVQ